MPFTPFHWGPALLIGLLVFPLLDLPGFLIASVIVDIEPLALLFLDGPVLHAFFHSYLGATLAGVALSPFLYLFRNVLGALLRLVGLEQSSSPLKIMVTSLLGTNFHVFLDSFLYTDIQPLFPLTVNPFYGLFTSGQVYFFCIIAFIVALPLYLFHLWRALKRKERKVPG